MSEKDNIFDIWNDKKKNIDVKSIKISFRQERYIGASIGKQYRVLNKWVTMGTFTRNWFWGF